MVFFEVGPRMLCEPTTGFMVLHKILPAVMLSLLIGGLLLPLLLNFGLPEFCSVWMHRLMRPVFRLPGHSAVTCIAAWFGDNCVGILIANQQYEQGYKTLREAVVISTTYSTVSLTFCLVVITQVDLVHLFMPFYTTVCLAGLVAAVIVPRLPPLASMPNTYIDGRLATGPEPPTKGEKTWSSAIETVACKTDVLKGLNTILTNIIVEVLILIMSVLPIAAVVATAALVLAEYTSLFQYLGKPFVPLLTCLKIPEAVNAAGCMVIGFADMMLPSVLAANIESELTRFFIAAMSVVQLVYLSEPGVLLIASKIRITLVDLFCIFIWRTLVAMPVVALMAHLCCGTP
jgi:nucleoside recognition membrane protein YjiH